jgi:transposase-like protein
MEGTTHRLPMTKEQRCWVHKTANVLDKLPKNKQPGAKEMIASDLDGGHA